MAPAYSYNAHSSGSGKKASASQLENMILQSSACRHGTDKHQSLQHILYHTRHLDHVTNNYYDGWKLPLRSAIKHAEGYKEHAHILDATGAPYDISIAVTQTWFGARINGHAILGPKHIQPRDSMHTLGIKHNYPRCCVNAFVDAVASGGSPGAEFYADARKIRCGADREDLITLLAYSLHVPCGRDCKATRTQVGEYRAVMRKDFPRIATLLENEMRKEFRR